MELNFPVDVVSDVVTTYWKDIRTALSELKAPIVNAHSFGNFTIKYWMLEKEKEKHLNTIDRIKERGSKRSEIIIEQLNEKVRLIDEMLKLLQSETQRKEFIKTHRKRNAKTNI